MGVELFVKTEEEIKTDEMVLVEAAKINQEAFGELYQRYVDRIYNYIYYRTGNVEDAEDLTARTFQRALSHIIRYEDKGLPFSAWLYRIARNLVSNWHRDQSKRHTLELNDTVHLHTNEGSPEFLIQMIENEETLLAAIQRLPDERQDLLIYKFLHRMSNEEIGEVMGRSEGAVKSLYHRTLLALREALGGESAHPQKPTKSSRFHLRFWERRQSNPEE